MSRYYVNETALQSHIDEMGKIAERLNQIQEEILSVRAALAISNGSANNLKSRLNQIASQTQEGKSSITKMSTAATTIARQYTQTELKVTSEVMKGASVSDIAGIISGWVSDFYSDIFNSMNKGQNGGDSVGEDETDDSNKGSILGGSIPCAGSIFGFTSAGEVSGDILGYEIDESSGVEWNWNKRELSVEAEKSITGYVAKGTAKGNIGIVSGSVTGSAVKGTASGGAKFKIIDDGKFAPSIGAEGEIEGSVVSGEAEAQIGSDINNVHGSAEGNVLGGEAKAGVAVGKMADGSKGIKAEARAEVYAAKGEVKGGFSLFGIDVEVGVTGKAGAVGVAAGGKVTNESMEMNAGAAAILGVEGEISVDWSDFELPKFNMPKFKTGW